MKELVRVSTGNAWAVVLGMGLAKLRVRCAIVIVATSVSHSLLVLAASAHDALVRLLMLPVVRIKSVDAVSNNVLGVLMTRWLGTIDLLSVIGVARGVEVLVAIVEQHVLGVVVDQVALLFAQLELGNEAGNSKLLDNLHDVELLIETCLSLGLKVIVPLVSVSAAAAPGGCEILLEEESPHGVFERLAPLCLQCKVLLESTFILRWRDLVMLLHSLVVVIIVIVAKMVVQLLGHRVVKRETLVSAKEVSNETKAEGEITTEALEGV